MCRRHAIQILYSWFTAIRVVVVVVAVVVHSIGRAAFFSRLFFRDNRLNARVRALITIKHNGNPSPAVVAKLICVRVLLSVRVSARVSACVSVRRNSKSVGDGDRTNVPYIDARSHAHTYTRPKLLCFGTRVLHYHRRFLFSQI